MFISPTTHISHQEWQAPIDVCKSGAVSYQCSATAAPPHLILHFDLNKTLIASDKEGKKTAHDVVSAEIAGRVIDYWDESLLFPMSYADYVKRILLPNPNNSVEIKFQQKEKIAQMLQFLQESKHPSYEKMQKMYVQSIETLEKQESQVFKSFYRLIEFLRGTKIPYTLVIRTFGSEGQEIAQELNKWLGENFIADFRILQQGHLSGSEPDLYRLVANTNHHLFIQDDWKWWFSHGQNWKYGKPFPVDLTDPNYISLFFDDNAGIDLLAPEENIVFPYDVVSGSPISPAELIARGQLIPVEMLDALRDENYYIRFIEKAMESRGVQTQKNGGDMTHKIR